MNRLKTTNGSTMCIFAIIDNDVHVHLGNIDTKTNRIYTTHEGYNLISTNAFKSNHKLEWFEEDKKSKYRKFCCSISFLQNELTSVIQMCNRELMFA